MNAVDEVRQKFGARTAEIHRRQGHMTNIFDKEFQPNEWFGYEQEKERIEMLENLLSEQAGRMGL